MTAEMAQFRERAAVLTVSDRASRGEYEDASGPRLAVLLQEAGWTVVATDIVADDLPAISAALEQLVREAAVVITTGGTGIGPRDVTADATRAIGDREVPGIAEALRSASLEKTPHAMLSRGAAVIRGKTLIVNLPGSPKGVAETFAVLEPVLGHAVSVLHDAPISEADHQAADRP